MKTEQIRVMQRILGSFFVSTAAQSDIDKAFHSYALAMRKQLEVLAENQTVENIISLLEITTEARLNMSNNQQECDIFTAMHIYLWQIFTTELPSVAEVFKQELERAQRSLRPKQREFKTASPQKQTAPASKAMAIWLEKQKTLNAEIKQLEVTVKAFTPPILSEQNTNVHRYLNDFTQKTQTAFAAIANDKDIPTLKAMLLPIRHHQRPPLFPTSPSISSSSAPLEPFYEDITSAPNIPTEHIITLQQEFISYLSLEQNVAEEVIDLINRDFGVLITDPSTQNWKNLAIHLNHTGLKNFEPCKVLYHVLINIIKNPPIIETPQEINQNPEPTSNKRKGLFTFIVSKKAKTESISQASADDTASIVMENWRQEVKQKINNQATSSSVSSVCSVSIVQPAALHQNVTVRTPNKNAKNKKRSFVNA